PEALGGAQKVVTAEEYETIERYKRLQEVLDVVEQQYYVDPDEDRLLQGAIDGLLESLDDPYTYYYTPEEMLSQSEHSAGIYEGVGLQLSADKQGDIVVVRAFKGGPAQRAGIKAGDIITAVGGRPVDGSSSKALSDAIDRIKGALDTTVRLSVLREGAKLEFELARGTISINRVEWQMLDGQIGYLMLYEFMGDDVTGFDEAIAALTGQGARALVIDVRSNPGGLLTDVVSIADRLLPEGLVVYIENRAGERENYYSDKEALGLPLAVLVNGMSASASEILAGAVQDYGVGTVVGETTYGKGIVQTLVPFRSDGAGMQLTTARYFTPKGRSIHGVGIVPDIAVAGDPDFDPSLSAPSPENDAQLRAAIERLTEQLASQRR
ncbi:MAG: S41 family peptidase, partial [Clostridiales bacterium]|nr:S41 family peptidase [Clostridiales bacterium]